MYDVEITAKNKSGEATTTLKGRLSSPRMSWTLCCSLKALRSAPTGSRTATRSLSSRLMAT
ncbi:MAG: hypothetical protein ACLT4Y_06420 [Bifidobacterium breve]